MREHPAKQVEERKIFETIATTYRYVLEPEREAMIKQLRHRLTTIPEGERNVLIQDIERVVGQDIEWETPES